MATLYPSQDACPIARMLNIFGDRWTLLVARDLVRGMTRFSEFRDSLQGASPNVVADRLQRLEQHGIVTRVVYNERPLRAEYRLTAKGETLRPILDAMYAWGEEHVPRRRAARKSRA